MNTPSNRVGDKLTEGLKNSVGFEDLLLHPSGDIAGDRAEVLQDELGGLRLACARLAGDDAGLVFVRGLQGRVRSLGQGEHVWLQQAQLLAMVVEHELLQREEGALITDKLSARGTARCKNIRRVQYCGPLPRTHGMDAFLG